MSLFSQVKRLLPPTTPLRVILIFVCVGQIIGAVGLVGYLSFRNGQKAVHDLSSQLRRELTARIEQELRGYFKVPHEINRLNADAFVRGDLDVVGATRGESQLYQQMVVAPTVALVYCGSARKGEFFGVLRSPQDGSLQFSYGNQSNQFLRYYYSLNVAGDRTYFLRQADRPFDARTRPWYKEAVVAERPIWTEVYIAFTTGLPNITAALPVYDRSGRRLLGVCGTDVVLPEEFRTFLRQLDIGQHGQAFVIDREGNLISNSTNEPLMQGQGQDARLLPAVNSQDLLVREAAKYLLTRFSRFTNIAQAQQLEFQLNQQRQYLEVVPFKDRYGLDWLIVVVVPEADFTAQIDVNTSNTILLCLITLVVAIAASIFAARWIAAPILQMARASQAISTGDLGQSVATNHITEINVLTTAFNTMATKLKQSFESLQYSEATTRALVEAIPDLMLRVRGDGTYIGNAIGSDRIKELFGKTSTLSNTSVYDSLPLEQAQQRMEVIQNALKTKTLQVYEHQLIINGQRLDEEVRVIVTGEDEVLVMVRDISDRKRAEEALRIAEENYRSIFENALEGIFQVLPGGKFITLNPAMAKIYGYASPQEMIAQITNMDEQLYVNPMECDEFKQQLLTQGKVEGFEYRTNCKDCSVIWVEMDARVVRDSNGDVLYYEGIVRNIEERKRLEEELRRQLSELQIEIDHQKREQDVAMITQSGYFQELQEEVATLDLDEFWSQ